MDWNIPLRAAKRLSEPVVLFPDYKEHIDPLETEGLHEYIGGANPVPPRNYGGYRFSGHLPTGAPPPRTGDNIGTLVRRGNLDENAHGLTLYHELHRNPKGTLGIDTSFFTGRNLGRSPAKNPREGIENLGDTFMDMQSIVKLLQPERLHFIAGGPGLSRAYDRFIPQMAQKLGASNWSAKGNMTPFYDLWFPNPRIYGKW